MTGRERHFSSIRRTCVRNVHGGQVLVYFLPLSYSLIVDVMLQGLVSGLSGSRMGSRDPIVDILAVPLGDTVDETFPTDSPRGVVEARTPPISWADYAFSLREL